MVDLDRNRGFVGWKGRKKSREDRDDGRARLSGEETRGAGTRWQMRGPFGRGTRKKREKKAKERGKMSWRSRWCVPPCAFRDAFVESSERCWSVRFGDRCPDLARSNPLPNRPIVDRFVNQTFL